MAKLNTPVAKSGTKGAVGKATVGDIEVTHLVVRSLKDGFRRAGRAWATTETTVPIGEFSDQEVEDLIAEPMLLVVPMSAGTPEKTGDPK